MMSQCTSLKTICEQIDAGTMDLNDDATRTTVDSFYKGFMTTGKSGRRLREGSPEMTLAPTATPTEHPTAAPITENVTEPTLDPTMAPTVSNTTGRPVEPTPSAGTAFPSPAPAPDSGERPCPTPGGCNRTESESFKPTDPPAPAPSGSPDGNAYNCQTKAELNFFCKSVCSEECSGADVSRIVGTLERALHLLFRCVFAS
jgi:hypothetical protein